MPLPSAVLPALPNSLLIGGRWRGAASTFAVYNPATGAELAQVADGTVADALQALDAAVAAGQEWARTPARVRSEMLRSAFELVKTRAEEFATLMTLEMGKPLTEARGEATYGGEFLRWFAEEAPRIQGRYTSAPEGNVRIMVTKRPVGPCYFVTPWNFPLAMATRKIAPALAAGCTCVIKPASATPLTTLAFASVLAEVGVPDGVVNVITTRASGEVSRAVLSDPRLRKLSFTGSTEVGRQLLGLASGGILRTSMELGGNAPFLVFDDADIEAAVAGAQAAKLRNIGEACTAANRFLVHREVAAEFSQRLAERFAALRVGDGMADGVDVGPLIDGRAREGVHGLVTGAVAEGARVLTGGTMPQGPGFFYPPTVLVDVPASARIGRAEIFGPVAAITTFDSEDEAVAMANDTSFGLAGYAYTRDVSRALRLSERIEVGLLGINMGVISNPAAPFGGVKQSGLGREGGIEGIEEYLEPVYVAFADPFG